MSKNFSSTSASASSGMKSTNKSLLPNGNVTSPIVSLLSLEDHSSHVRSVVPFSTPLFQPLPAVLTFSDYQPFRPVTATLLLTNQDHVSRRVKIEHPKDHHFKIIATSRPGLSATQSIQKSMTSTKSGIPVINEEKENIEEMGSSKIAPGMAIQYTIQFTPRDRSDYSCDLICTTEREQFLIPIRAQGDRPSIEMPTELDFGLAPVYYPTIRPILIRNNGPIPAQFSFSVTPVSAPAANLSADEPPPFTVEPTHGVLAVDESIQVLVSFTPNARGPVAYQLVADISSDGVSAISDANLGQSQRMNASFTGTGSNFAALTSPIVPTSSLATSANFGASSSNIASVISPAAFKRNVLVTMNLSGAGQDVKIELDTRSVICDSTYVGLKSQKTVILHNHSDIPISFALKNFASKSLDLQFKQARIRELQDQEAVERSHMDEVVYRLKEDEEEAKAQAKHARRQQRIQERHEARRAQAEAEGHEFDSSDDEQDELGVDDEEDVLTIDPDADPEELHQLDLLRAEQYIVRKYQRLHRALDSTTLTQFQNQYYSIDPIDGEIWPRGSKELTITFSPDAAGMFSTMIYVEVSGRFDRIPMDVSGKGLGAEARFSYSTMDIGNVYMNAPHRYEITLQNIGNIPVSWRLMPERGLGGQGMTKDQSRFKFSPSEGTLQVTPGGPGADEEDLTVVRAGADAHDRVTIQVDFLSANIGEFLETIFFELLGNNDPLKVVYKGKVIGPTFYFEESQLDYGLVSYGFLNSRVLHLHNTSAIEMKIKLHIDQDGEFIDREFGMILLSNLLEDENGQDIVEEDEDAWSFEPKKSDPINLTVTSGNVATIPAYHHAQIQVDFISESANKKYDDKSSPYELLVDVEGVGENLITIPIKALCQVPIPVVERDTVAYDTVFLRHTYEQFIPLRNDSDLFAKFEVSPQDEHSKGTVIVEPEVYSANIAPHSTYQLKMLLTAHRLGSFQQPFYITIPGSTAIPFVIHASFTCRGPKVLLDSKSVNFGSIPALTPNVKILTLHNDSPISARFKAFVHKKGSCYSLDINRGTIAPFGRQPIQITAYLNETLPMMDQLHVLIEEGDDLIIPLKAHGTGTTVATTLTEGVNVVDHGDQLTNTPISREFRLENRGRRTQILQWEFVPDLPPTHTRSSPKSATTTSSSLTESKSPEKPVNPLDILSRVARMKKLGNEADVASLPTPVFCISPSKITLEPNTAMVFTLSGLATRPGRVNERWICKSLVGQAKKLEVIYDTAIRANFLTPFLSFSSTSLNFTQILDPKTPLVLPEPQTLTLTNKTPLPLKFRLKVPLPFAASTSDFLLEAGATAETIVRFVPDITEVPGQPSPYNKTSVKIKQDLTVVYADHPQRDRLVLFGDLCYPNLTFSTNKIDFGSILNETSKRMLITITNNSTIEATYRWFFSDQAFGKSAVTSRPSSRQGTPNSGRRMTPSSGRRGTPNPTLKMGTDAASLPMNELFDILPIRGSLKPGESEEVEFTFYGHQEMKVTGVALCEVEGGPDYEVKLKGEASSVSYSLDCTQIQFGPHDINFGPQDIFATTWKEILLANNGRVAFDFQTLPPENNLLPLIECNPSAGKLKAGEKIKLMVRFSQAKPDSLEGILQLQVGCFDPIPIFFSAVGVLPVLAVDLPTEIDWAAQQSDETKFLETAEFSVARYVADLGPIIKNTVGELTFTIRNVGPVFASYTMDKKSFHSSIFSIEPTMVTRVPPGQSTTFTVVCRATNPTKNKIQKKDIFEGREFLSVGVPILVRNGPPMLLHICAQVTIPDVLVSQTKLDFGRVVLNQRREIAIQLHNHKPVPATFTFANPVGSNVRDRDCFELVPETGTLLPGEKVNIIVSYTPSLLEERKSTVRIPFKIDRNPKLFNLMATGSGVATIVTFDPPLLRLPNTLPYAPTKPTPFALVNHSDRPVEVYSLDYDRAYEREELILAGDEGFDNPAHPNIMYLEPRKPGESLPAEILQRFKLRAKRAKRLEEEQRAKENINATEVGALVAADAALVADATSINGVPLNSANINTRSTASLSDLSAELVRNILIIGAPYAGKSTLARALVSKLELKPHQVFNLDTAVRYFYDLTEKDTEEAETLALREKEYNKDYEKWSKKFSKERKNGVLLTPDEVHAAVVSEIGALDIRSVLQVTPEQRTLAGQVLAAINNARARLTLEAQEAALAAKLAKKAGTPSSKSKAQPVAANPADSTSSASPRQSISARGKSGAKGSVPSGLFEPDQELTDYMTSHTFNDLRNQNVLSEEILADVLFQYTLIQNGETFRQGLIIDGLDNSFTDAVGTARIIRTAFARMGELTAANTPIRENNLHIIALDITRPEATSRLQAARLRAKSLLDDESLAAMLKKFKVLSSRDIDKLPDIKRQEYERILDLYTKRREAEVTLYQIDHLDPIRFEQYWKEAPAVESAAIDANSPVTESSTSAAAIPIDLGEPVSSSSDSPSIDPLAEVLSVLDIPSFLPATEMPPIQLPEEVIPVPTEEERLAAEEAERVRVEAEVKEAEALAAKLKEEEEAANKRGSKKKKLTSSATSPTRSPSADGRKPTGTVEVVPPPVVIPAYLQPSKWDAVPVRASSMSGLPSLKFIKVRRFESAENLNRLLNTTLPWIEDIFRTEIDPRSLDPNWIPPPITYQIIPRPGLRKRRHIKSPNGFVLVDPVIEEEILQARLAAEAADLKKAADEAAALAEEENKKRAKSGTATSSKSPSRRGTEIPSDMTALVTATTTATAVAPTRKVATRWVIPPHSSQVVYVSFTAQHVGSYSSSLGFELVGGTTELELGVESICGVPEIANDPRSIFMKKPKVSKPGVILSKTYLANEKVFEFGPVLIGKDPDTRYQPLTAPQIAPSNGLVNNEASAPININGLVLQPLPSKKTNADVWRISNSGPFATHIDLSFLMGVDSNAGSVTTTIDPKKGRSRKDAASPTKERSPSPSPTGPTPRDGKEEKSSKGDKKSGKKAGGLSEKDLKALEKQRELDRQAEEARWEVLRGKRIFLVEPCSFDLGIDESRDITVWAFPQNQHTFTDTLVVTVKDNPAPVLFPVRCQGAKPSINLSSCDITFDRLLLSKEETRTVDIINTSPLPVVWSITGLDQLPGDDILSIGPVTRGIIQPNSPPMTVFIHFNALEEKAFHIPLTVEARDVEGFLGVLDSIPLTINCESYQNKAHVDFGLTAAGTPASEINFDLLRVHDQSEQTFTLVNEGLYEVRYKLVSKSSLNSLAFNRMFLVTPAEGILAAGYKQDIIVTLKPDREFKWNRDTCLKLYLYETAGSDTPTKKYDIPISASATYSKYHILPSTSVNFGPIETGVQTNKSIVIYNDGPFDFEYRFFPTKSDHVYSRAAVIQRSDEKEKAESEKPSKAASSSSKKKDANQVPFKLGTRAKPIAPMTRPTPSPPQAISHHTKGGKEDKKHKSVTPRGQDKPSATASRGQSASGDKSDRKMPTGASTPKSSSDRPGKKPKPGEFVIYDQPSELELGVFTLHNPCGFVAAGQSIELDVSMYSELPAGIFDEGLELEIANMEPSTAIIPYALEAESVTPGLETKNVRAIFEEQEVRPTTQRRSKVKSMEQRDSADIEIEPEKDFYAQKENVFIFAPVIVNHPGTPAAIQSPNAKSKSPAHSRVASPHGDESSRKKTDSPSPRSSTSGSALPSERTPGRKKPAAVVEPPKDEHLPPVQGRTVRFKIINPFKVPANVSFFLHNSPPPPPVILSPTAAREAKEAANKKGAKGSANRESSAGPAGGSPTKKTLTRAERAALEAVQPVTAFTLGEQSMTIPPNDYRYASVTFKPDAVQSYNTWFEALVESGLDVATRSLLFELRGDGTLPTLTVVNPTVKDEEQRPLLDFHRLFHGSGSTATRSVTLKNDGLVPATARFDLLVRAPGSTTLQLVPSTSSSFFGFSGRGKLVTLLPGETTNLTASFTPPGVGIYSAELRMSIVSNTHGSVTFAMKGESFMQDVTVESAGLETVPFIAPAVTPEEAALKERAERSTRGKDVAELPVTIPLVQHLGFPDTSITTPISQVLTLVNHSDLPYRFAWTAPPAPNAVDAVNAKRSRRGGASADAAGSATTGGGGSLSKKKEKELEEEKKRAEEEAKKRAEDGSAAAANALSLALAAAAANEPADPSAPDFTFTPSIGHLPPHSSKNITVTFRSATVRQYVHTLATCQLQRIKYVNPDIVSPTKTDKKDRGISADSSKRKKDKVEEEKVAESVEVPFVPANADWDNAQTSVKWITESEAKERAEAAATHKEKSKASKPVKTSGKNSARTAVSGSDESMVQVTEVAPEPAYELIDPPVVESHKKSSSSSGEGASRTLSKAAAPQVNTSTLGSTVTSSIELRLSAVADVSRYELALPSNVVHFRPTFMYQTRAFTFVMNNPASTRLAYSWKIDPLTFAGDEDVEEPFTITPASGVIQPRQNQTFTLKFSPLASRDYRTVIRAIIPDLNENQEPPVIELRGTSLRPKCHFELPPNDYLTSNRRPANLTTPIDPATRVLEFKSLGVRVKNLRKFYVVNPTDVSYAFHWKNEDAEVAAALAATTTSPPAVTSPLVTGTSSSPFNVSGDARLLPSSPAATTTTHVSLKNPFKCLTPKGIIESGRKFEMIFEYTPQLEVASESRWRFIIPNLESKGQDETGSSPASLEVPFLLAGCVSQPFLELDRTFLNFHALIVGQKRTETIHLTNLENASFQWNVDRNTYNESMADVLSITPTSGLITANSKFPLEITLRPNSEQQYNFNINFIVKSKPTKLSLNIKGEGYDLRTELVMVPGDEDAERERRRLRILEKEQKEAAEAAAAAAALAEQASSKNKRASTGKLRLEKTTPASASATVTSGVPSIVLPAIPGAAPLVSASSPQGPPAPTIPLGGLTDLNEFGYDLSEARDLHVLTQNASWTSTLQLTSHYLPSSNRIDFGTWPTHTRRVQHLLLRNTGQFHVDFKCVLPANKLFKFSPASGQIKSGHTMVIDLIGGSREEQEVHALKAFIYVAGLKKYALTINGVTNKPNRFAMLTK